MTLQRFRDNATLNIIVNKSSTVICEIVEHIVETTRQDTLKITVKKR